MVTEPEADHHVQFHTDRGHRPVKRERVLAVAAGGNPSFAGAGDYVVTTLAIHVIAAAISDEEISSVAALEHITKRSAEHGVVAASACERQAFDAPELCEVADVRAHAALRDVNSKVVGRHGAVEIEEIGAAAAANAV